MCVGTLSLSVSYAVLLRPNKVETVVEQGISLAMMVSICGYRLSKQACVVLVAKEKHDVSSFMLLSLVKLTHSIRLRNVFQCDISLITTLLVSVDFPNNASKIPWRTDYG